MKAYKHPNASHLLALFGGTFDPIHYGHLQPVENLAAEVGLDKVILLPNNVPPHRPQPQATSEQRLEMVKLAVAGNPLFAVDDRELRVKTPSYTVETLEILRQEQGNKRPLAFIIGQDSLLSIHKWHRWNSLLDICHLLVMARPGYPDELETAELQSWLENHQAFHPEELRKKPHGYIYLANTPLLNISATEIRQRSLAEHDCSDLLPSSVERYIKSQGLYRAG